MSPQDLARELAAGARAVALCTDEEDRALELAELAATSCGLVTHTWSPAHPGPGGARSLASLLEALDGRPDDELWVLLDPAWDPPTPTTRRLLRERAQSGSGPRLLLVQPAPGWLTELPEVEFHHLPPPATEELEESAAPWAGDGARSAAWARAGLGLSRRAFERALASAAEGGPEAAAQAIAQAKVRHLTRGGFLVAAPPLPPDELGGLPAFKAWLTRRARALEPDAHAAGIPWPRGVLLVGVPGCGKSLAARVCASALGLPLLRLDVGRLFGGTVGASEANLRRVLATLDRMAPVTLWLDEVDKGLAGVDGGASDAGTTARVVGHLLTWLQERERPAFVAATANRIAHLPPELLRRGRLDEVFFVDLPDADARANILRVHLTIAPARRLGAAPPLAAPEPAFLQLARDAEGRTGAELEAALVEARLAAYCEGRPLAPADLAAALDASVPQLRTHAEAIEHLRAWATTRARLA